MNSTQKINQNTDVDIDSVDDYTESRRVKLEVGGAFQEVRCKGCNALLYRVRFLQKGKSDHIEIKCKRCKTINSQ